MVVIVHGKNKYVYMIVIVYGYTHANNTQHYNN